MDKPVSAIVEVLWAEEGATLDASGRGYRASRGAVHTSAKHEAGAPAAGLRDALAAGAGHA